MSSELELEFSGLATDKIWMRQCIEIAKSNVDPIGNKTVGAVMMGFSRGLYTGCRHTFINHNNVPHKTIHAEQFIIWEAGEDARGAELYVTMEPCAKRWHNNSNYHYPSCVEYIIRAGIKKVYIGKLDKDFGGGGVQALLKAGVQVVHVLGMEKDIAALNENQRVEPIVQEEFKEFINEV
jgi:diaminohydroxyphosphoribosylaminopyrimidine deaminase/5-amino-6-(5-phosphoribosylamino)uracil reductase